MTRDQTNSDWLHYLRKVELDCIIKRLPEKKEIKILEIGGGDGYQAKYLADKGYDIISIDNYPKKPQIFEVQKKSVSKLDFPEEYFDVIISSHVLQHIKEIDLAFHEMKKVLKKNGIMIHIVPTSYWTIITGFLHYILLPKYYLEYRQRRKNKEQMEISIQEDNYEKKNKMMDFIFLHPLGENPSFIHELYYFSAYYWKKLFRKYGYDIVSFSKGPLFYSGHEILKMKVLNLRKLLAKISLTSSYCFTIKLAQYL